MPQNMALVLQYFRMASPLPMLAGLFQRLKKAQIGKEMLAVSYGLTRFHQYTYGRDVRVITDHKPLVSIVTKLGGGPGLHF